MRSQDTMLKKLRGKFVALNMAMVTAVLVAVLAAIGYLDYRQSVESVYAALDGAIERATSSLVVGTGPGAGLGAEAPAGGMLPEAEGTPPEIGGPREEGMRVIPAAVYLALPDGLLELAPAGSTAVLSDEVLVQAAALLADAPDGSGSLGSQSLYYAKRTTPEGVYLAFADASAASSWQQMALLLGGVGVVTVALFLLISVFFSRWALRPVERAWVQQQQFVADASHELKTPLTVILANTAILRAHPERSVASQSQWVESTQTEAERMQELVCDMLELAQPMGAAQANPVRTSVNLTDVVETEALQFESVAFERGVLIRTELEPDVLVPGDQKRLHRLASTLIDNACKYSDAGGTVTVRLSREMQGAKLSVHNEGRTIPAEDLPHVFDRFYRADKARTRDAGRTEAGDVAHEGGSYGLGLAIAREVAEQHGGTISVESTAALGTTFTATLPC